MKKHLKRLINISIVIGYSLHSIANAGEAKHCDSVLEHGARNFVSRLSFDDQKSYIYHKACNNKYSNSNRSARFSIETMIKETPLGIDFSSSRANRKLDEWCKENAGYEQEYHHTKNLENSVYQPAISAWLSCISAFSEGLKVDTSISDDKHAIAFLITNDSKVRDVTLRGLSIADQDSNSVVCSLMGNEKTIMANQETKTPLPPKQSINIYCTRKKTVVQRDKQSLEILPAGSITISTKLKDFQYSFPEESILKLTDLRADDLQAELSSLKNGLIDGHIQVKSSKEAENLRVTRAGCSWHAVISQGQYICPANNYVAGVCFTNQSGGCKIPRGKAGVWVSAGGVYCCPH